VPLGTLRAVAGTGDARDGRQQLITVVRGQAAATECWQRAETVLRAGELRERLDALGIAPTADLAAGLMAAAMLLAATSDEWGGDYRDALGDLAALGLELFEG
jgi:hypothetical protein